MDSPPIYLSQKIYEKGAKVNYGISKKEKNCCISNRSLSVLCSGFSLVDLY